MGSDLGDHNHRQLPVVWGPLCSVAAERGFLMHARSCSFPLQGRGGVYIDMRGLVGEWHLLILRCDGSRATGVRVRSIRLDNREILAAPADAGVFFEATGEPNRTVGRHFDIALDAGEAAVSLEVTITGEIKEVVVWEVIPQPDRIAWRDRVFSTYAEGADFGFVDRPPSSDIASCLERAQALVCEHDRDPCILRCGVRRRRPMRSGLSDVDDV